MNDRRVAAATGFLLAAAVLAQAGPAAADPEQTAEAASKRGRALLKGGRIHEACQAFENSAELDAKIETELSLADCYEQDGKLMSAARLYNRLADKDSNGDRSRKSLAKATRLENRAPRLRFAINPRPDGLVIKVDGVDVSDTGDVPVDIGPHEVVATAPGFEGRASAATDRERVILDVIIRMEPREEPTPRAAPAGPTPAVAEPTPAPTATAAPLVSSGVVDQPTRGGRRKTYGIMLTVAGGASVVGAAVSFGVAASRFDDERELCPNSTCANEMDLARADALLSNGTTYRNIGIGASIGGLALLSAGTYLLLTPDKQPSNVSVQVSPGGASLVYTRGF